MKAYFVFPALIILLLSLNSFASDEDGGWSSSGGGEFITDQYNPWFIRHLEDGKEVITWCIDHGGEKNFSLSIDESKKAIEEALSLMTKEIEEAKSVNLCFEYAPTFRKFITTPCESIPSPFPLPNPPGNKNKLTLNTNFKYSKDCNEKTDLTFILGNPENQKFKKLLKIHGKEKLTKFGGVAIRTNYEITKDKFIKGRGFISIASDRGEYRYTGKGGLLNSDQVRDIWNYKYLYQDVKYLVHPHINLEKETASPFLATVLHELGHVYGFKHRDTAPDTNASNLYNVYQRPVKEVYWMDGYNTHIMDESFVAKVITSGGLPRYALKNSLGYFGKGINKLSGRIDRDNSLNYSYEDMRIAIRLKIKGNSRRYNNLGYIDPALSNFLKNEKALFFEINQERIFLSALKYNKMIHPCIPDTDYPFFDEDGNYKFKSASECSSFHKKNDPKDFKFIKTKLAESPFNRLTWGQIKKDSMKLKIADTHISSGGIQFTTQTVLNLITMFEKSFSFKIDLEINNRTVPYMVRLNLDSDGLQSNIEFMNLNNFTTSRIETQGLMFFDRKKIGAELPKFFGN